MEVFPDYYGILGVPRYTTAQGIRRAYLRKARQHHPDLHHDDPNADSEMGAINVAYTTLCNPARRAEYDTRRVAFNARVAPRKRPVRSSTSKVRYSGKEEPTVFHVALALFTRLFRYVTALLLL